MVIWMAEEMNPSCANKLLKIIEEPPNKTLFILLAESQEYMLQTIISRCQIVKVPRIKLEDLSKHLSSNLKVGGGNADSVASRVDGDLIEALEFLGDHEEQDENRRQFIQLMRVCYKKSVLEMIQWSEEIAAVSREQQKVFLKYALHMFLHVHICSYIFQTFISEVCMFMIRCHSASFSFRCRFLCFGRRMGEIICVTSFCRKMQIELRLHGGTNMRCRWFSFL